MKSKMGVYQQGVYAMVDIQQLPETLEVEIKLDIGDNSSSSMRDKLGFVGQNVLPQLNQAGAGAAVRTDAPAIIATKIIEALGLEAHDYLEDYTTDEFKEQARKASEEQSKRQKQQEELELRVKQAEAALAEANVSYTSAQAMNTQDDNSRQLAVAIDKHFQEWADLHIKAVKEGADLPPSPDFGTIIQMAAQIGPEQQREQAPQQQPQQGGQ